MTDTSEDQPVVLVVDDERDNRDLICRVLAEHSNVRSVVASNGADALALVRSMSIDILVVDQRMPTMTGYELLQHVRALGAKPQAIMVTAFPDDPEVALAQREGYVHCVISKPWDREEMGMAIDVVIKMAGRRRKA